MSELEVINGIQKVLGKLSEEKHKKRFKKWNKTIGFTFKDFRKTWVTILTAGVPSQLEEREMDKSINFDIQVITTPAVWLGVLNKEIDALKAFSSGDLKIKGSVTDLLRLKKVL